MQLTEHFIILKQKNKATMCRLIFTIYCSYFGGLIWPPSPPVSPPGGVSPGSVGSVSPGSASAVFTVVVPPQDAEWFVFDGVANPNRIAINKGMNILSKI
jgi:hypothetical protein